MLFYIRETILKMVMICGKLRTLDDKGMLTIPVIPFYVFTLSLPLIYFRQEADTYLRVY